MFTKCTNTRLCHGSHIESSTEIHIRLKALPCILTCAFVLCSADMTDVKWKDLPAELLPQISSSCGGPNGMHKVCKDWKNGLEANSTKLAVTNCYLPNGLPERFPVLKLLDLQACKSMVTPRVIQLLEGLPLTHLSIKIPARKITNMLVRGMHVLGLTTLELELAGGACRFEDAHLWRLSGKFISFLLFIMANICKPGLLVGSAALSPLP